MASGVYSIENTKNGLVYVGQSANIKTRWQEHVRTLKANKHPNRRLQADWNEHGESAFKFSIIEKCTYDQLANRERHYIKRYTGYCYNSTKRNAPKAQTRPVLEPAIVVVQQPPPRQQGIQATSQFKTLQCVARHIVTTVEKLIYYLDLPIGTVFIHLRLLKLDGYVDVSMESTEVRYLLTEKGRQAVHNDTQIDIAA